jgi:hypothetical protein
MDRSEETGRTERELAATLQSADYTNGYRTLKIVSTTEPAANSGQQANGHLTLPRNMQNGVIVRKIQVTLLHKFMTLKSDGVFKSHNRSTHKRLGIMYILYALVFLLIAGLEATIARIQLMARTTILFRRRSSTACSRMHGTTMISFVVMHHLSALRLRSSRSRQKMKLIDLRPSSRDRAPRTRVA